MSKLKKMSEFNILDSTKLKKISGGKTVADYGGSATQYCGINETCNAGYTDVSGYMATDTDTPYGYVTGPWTWFNSTDPKYHWLLQP